MTSPALDAFRIEIDSLELSQKAKADLIRTWLEKVRLDNANLALVIHEGLEA
jgi:hypothetical protein